MPWARLGTTALALLILAGRAHTVAPDRPGIALDSSGRLVYTADERGNTVVDFSSAGYGGGGVPLPAPPVRMKVSPADGDDGARIQAAIDAVAKWPVDESGMRGAVALAPGRFETIGTIRLNASGVVLRGAGSGDAGTTIVAAGTSRRTLVEIGGPGGRREENGAAYSVVDEYVPVGARALAIANDHRLLVGDHILVRRPSTAAWIDRLGMNLFQGWRPENRLHWQPGSRDIAWDRVVTAVEGARLTLDAPLTTALDRAVGGGSVVRVTYPGVLRHVGLEHLRLESAVDPTRPLDEDHAWFGVSIDAAHHAWVRGLHVSHFVSTAVDVKSGARWVTVQDVEAVDPVGEPGGHRGHMFATSGQQTLFERCRARGGRHDFVTGFAAAGPNVFLDCESTEARGFSGPLESWASGTLYDNVRIGGDALRLGNRGDADQGMGWAAANSVLWNCRATDVEATSPPGAFNLAYGSTGTAAGDGIVEDPRVVPFRDFFRAVAVQPASLYRAQLGTRGEGPRALAPKPEDEARYPTSPDQRAPVGEGATRHAPLEARDGRFVIDGRPAWTERVQPSWFQAQLAPALAPTFGPAITRFAPGRGGTGLTDDLEAVVRGMPPGAVFYQHYGLWYDRRRVNHNYDGSAERKAGDVWAPFMELPWARSGRGKAWDGLSRFDLGRFNSWYFDRVKTFADLCDRTGRVLYYNFYFQHWLLESRSHYVDFPWRPGNAVQETGMPDEGPAARAFWDVTHAVRLDLHRRYIRHVLDTLGHNTNVVYGLDREYTGSLEFVRFWLDEISAWQRTHNRRLFVALEIPKDQMDAILEDPLRGALVTAVDFHGWVYRPDGRLFAIRGDVDRSPREQRADIATPGELEALRARLDPALTANPDYQNGPEFQRLFDRLWASTPSLQAQALRHYRERYPHLVLLAETSRP